MPSVEPPADSKSSFIWLTLPNSTSASRNTSLWRSTIICRTTVSWEISMHNLQKFFWNEITQFQGKQLKLSDKFKTRRRVHSWTNNFSDFVLGLNIWRLRLAKVGFCIFFGAVSIFIQTRWFFRYIPVFTLPRIYFSVFIRNLFERQLHAYTLFNESHRSLVLAFQSEISWNQR